MPAWSAPARQLGSFTFLQNEGNGVRSAAPFLAAALLLPAFAQTPPVAAPPAAHFPLQELSESFEKLAAKVRPCIMQIFSTGYARSVPQKKATARTRRVSYPDSRPRAPVSSFPMTATS